MSIDIGHYCEEHATEIYVREFVNGTWKSVLLSKLPEESQKKHIAEWESDGFIPHRVK